MFVFVLLLVVGCVYSQDFECGISPNIEHYSKKLSDPNYHPGSDKVIGGKISKNGDWPWAVYCECTGSLIHPQWFLTAKHCMVKAGQIIYFGNVNKDLASPVTVEASFHVGDPGNYSKDDISLVKLSEPLQLNDHVNVICLPSKALNKSEGVLDVVAGWGAIHADSEMTPMLHEDVIPLQNASYCGIVPDFPLVEPDICGGYGTHGASHGDSGGPLMQLVDGKWVIHGITSRGQLPVIRAQDIWTNVFYFCDWIKETTNNEVSCPE